MIKVSRTRLNWHGPSVSRDLRNEMKVRLAAAAEALAAKIRQNISVQGPPASRPSEYPHKVSGELESSVVVKLDLRSLSVEVHDTAPHAMAVEKRRPFMRRTLREMKPELRRIVLNGQGSGGRGMFKFSR